RLRAAVLLAAAAVTASAAAAQDGWPELVRRHLQLHPEARAQDIYKLVYQGTMGNEIVAADPSAVERRLEREMSDARADGSEPLTEPVSPDGRLVRLNLRPYKAQGGSAAALAKAVIQTA